ncbi:MAG: acetoin utilization protein AcuC [Gammaproteobacteria bacterium]|nr:acetoin utilization protein AcuC [Gammaproteobacteria bacterium]MBM4230587.1 acetoin utilization protein AcuC [Gammaproteobacteria bacterium]
MSEVLVIAGERLARYGFGNGHPWGPDRHAAFYREFESRGLERRCRVQDTRAATADEILLFHTPEYLNFLCERSRAGSGYLDGGDTPAFNGVFEAAADVVGGTLVAAESIMAGRARRAFVPIAGLHHAGRSGAAGFCALNDCGIAIEWLRREYALTRIAYVDIDAHHGDGVFYGFEDDAQVIFADIHEDGRFLYPGTGSADECGKGAARGSKLNLPLQPGADDAVFDAAWQQVLRHLESCAPEFLLLQCGADSLAGDPLTHLAFSSAAHGRAARDLTALAERLGHGRVLATGGGGYNRQNIAAGWNAVVEGLFG